MARAFIIQETKWSYLSTSHQLQPLPALTCNAHFSDYLPTDGASGHGRGQVKGDEDSENYSSLILSFLPLPGFLASVSIGFLIP